MTFRVAARTLLHLGAELISSDGVAFYELIKNGLDAGSRIVRLEVVIALPQPTFRALQAEIDLYSDWQEPSENGSASSAPLFERVHAAACKGINSSASTAPEALDRLRNAATWNELSAALASISSELNCIIVSDTGTGMSLQDLSDIYLTIGTPVRLLERDLRKAERWDDEASSNRRRPILGEKGVGRLSVMRLGDQLHVETSRAGEAHWNVLDIDWSRFTENVNALIEDIPVLPLLGAPKEDPTLSGTTIRISKLSAAWSRDRLDDIVRREFSKLVDPFTAGVRLPVSVFFNGSQIEIPRFNRVLFEHAHATIHATYTIDPEPRLSGRIWYVGNRNAPGDERETSFALAGTHIVSTVGGMLLQEDITMDTLRSLGPFTLTLYWYNRKRVSPIEGIGKQRAVLDLLSSWAGGILVFRDNFRVSPYGNPDDDWLDLDRRALAASSFKVNRRQIIGKIDITSAGNPQLVDQTNREGLRDTVEKRVLVRLLKWVIEIRLLGFLNAVDDEKPAAERVNLDDLEARIRKHDDELDDMMARLSREHPEVDHKYRISTLINSSRQELRSTIAEVRQRADAYEAGRAQLVHLAGVGLMVESLAHELNRATAHTLATLTDVERQNLPIHLARVFSGLEAQLRSLQKRLRTLDPLSTRGRQVKESFDLVMWVQETLESHYAQFQRHGIRLSYSTFPERNAQFRVQAVKGMIVQVLENLISNSIYWLKQERKLTPAFQPEIHVVVDAIAKQVRFTDNGPGIEPSRQELVFEPFHSTKPPGAGSGLGLFIAREIAEYHGASLYLEPTPSGPNQTLHTFVFDLHPAQQNN